MNRLCVLATLINGAVYAPWLSFPLPDMPTGEPVNVAAPEPAGPPVWQAVQGELFGEAGT